MINRDTYKHLFQNANDAQYILDMENRRFLDVNPAFEELTGYSREEIVEEEMDPSTIIDSESKTVLEEKRKEREHVKSDRYELKVLTREGNEKVVGVSVQRVKLENREVVIGTARDLTERKELESDLRSRLNEVMEANRRILALTEKIQNVPEITSALLDVESKDELFEKGAELMSNRTGLDYDEITFYLFDRDGNILENRYSTRKNPTEKIHPEESEEIRDLVLGKKPLYQDGDSFYLPLEGRDQILGILEVQLDSRERVLMEGNNTAWGGYKEVLSTLGNTLGLIFQNRQLNKKLRQQSIRDELTQTYNRRFFNQKITEELSRARRYEHPLSLLVIDLDKFKTINDTYGHTEGDRILKEVCRVLQNCCRETDWIFRYGGDEFLILLPETDRDGARTKADHLLDRIEAHSFTVRTGSGTTRDINLTFSIGLSCFDWREDNLKSKEDILKEADKCMYRAKESRGNRLEVPTS